MATAIERVLIVEDDHKTADIVRRFFAGVSLRSPTTIVSWAAASLCPSVTEFMFRKRDS